MFNRNHIPILFLSLLMCLGIGVVFGENGNGENWSTTRNITGNTYQQLKAYITSGSDFRYYFNGNSQAMKQMFNNVFKDPTKMQELWTANENFFKKFKLPNGENISEWQQVNQLAESNLLLNHDLLKFIK